MSNNLSLTIYSILIRYSQIFLYKGNLLSDHEYELMHQFIVYQFGKRSKVCQTTYHSQHPILTRYSQMCPYKGNLLSECELMHQFTAYQVGKRRNICQTTYHSQHSILTRYSVSVQRQPTLWV